MTGFQRLCLVTCAVVFALIIIGGAVRATDSGLGCPDWPRCHGSFIPKWETHTLIEYSHRLTASIVGLLMLAIAVVAWRSYRRVPAVFVPAIAAFALTLFQAWLGSRVVLEELPPRTVALHLGIAMTILSLLLVLTTAAFAVDRPLMPPAVSRSFGQVAIIAASTTIALMILGAYISSSHYGLACNGWPLCNGAVVPNLNAGSVQLIFLHRLLALADSVLIGALVWMAWRAKDQAPVAFTIALGVLGVFVLQALVGAANVWSRLADGVTIAHLGVGTLLWVLLAVLNIRVHRLHELLPLPLRAQAGTDLAGAAR